MQQRHRSQTTRRRLSLLCAATTAFTCIGLHADDNKASDSEDTSFLNEVARGGKMEVELGRLGAQKGQSAEVKQFGERLANDHSKANDELMQLAQKKGITLDTASGHKEASLDRFSNKSGADFDKAFTTHMIKDHKKDISKFEKEAKETNDPDLKAWIDKTLPTLREHLQTAESIGKTLGIDEKSITLNEDNYTVQPTANAGGQVNIQSETRSDSQRKDLGLTTGVNQDNTAATSGTQPKDLGVDAGVNTDSTKSDRSSTYSSSSGTAPSSTSSSDTSVSANTSSSTSSSMDNSTPQKSHVFSMDKNDGKLWGIIPWHRRHSSAEVDSSVGAPPSGTTESSGEHHVEARRLSFNDVPKAVQDTITAQGGTTDLKNIKRETENGKTVYVVSIKRQGDKKTTLHIDEDGSIENNRVK